MFAFSAQKDRLKENECTKHMHQITLSGKGLAPFLFRLPGKETPTDQAAVEGELEVKTGSNPLAFRYFSMRSRLREASVPPSCLDPRPGRAGSNGRRGPPRWGASHRAPRARCG